MVRFAKLRKSFSKVKKPLKHASNVKWFIPGWIFYEYYKMHKDKGYTKRKSFIHGAKAEIFRLAATASLPVPGTYELTTTGLALVKNKIENDEIDKLSLKAFRDFTPLKKFRMGNRKLIGSPYLKIYFKDKKLHFNVFYKKR